MNYQTTVHIYSEMEQLNAIIIEHTKWKKMYLSQFALYYCKKTVDENDYQPFQLAENIID